MRLAVRRAGVASNGSGLALEQVALDVLQLPIQAIPQSG
jgi:hypothetical protein